MGWFNTIINITILTFATGLFLKADGIIKKEENERQWREVREEIEEFLSDMEETEENKYVKERLLEVLESVQNVD